jgi:GGDEF domain-containing protein
MATAAIAASAALLALAVGAIVVRSRRARADRRFEAVLEALDRHMSAIAKSLQRVVDRSAEARARSVDQLELTIDFDELLRRIAAEAAARTQSEAAAVHVVGPDGSPVAATFGTEDRAELLEAPLAHGAGAFRAVTVNWTYRPGFGGDTGGLSSALVVPILEEGVQAGTLAAYVPEHEAFGADHVRALERLAEEAAPAIASARRFGEAQLALTDPTTGLRNQKGYEAELERAVARAEETTEPLSLLILAAAGGNRPRGSPNELVADLAALLAGLPRAADAVCRRRPEQLAIVLPETTGEAARSFYARLRHEALRASRPEPAAFRAGLAEWRPGETSDAFDTRAAASADRSRLEPLELLAEAESTEHVAGEAETRAGFRDRLVREIARARQLDRPLALVVMDVVDELRRVGDEQGAIAAEDARAAVEARVQANLQNGHLSSWIGEDAVALILGGSTASEAESVFAALQSPPGTQSTSAFDWLAVSAGITELSWGDDAGSVFGRAEHALWRAKRAGRGTVVVATASDDSWH